MTLRILATIAAGLLVGHVATRTIALAAYAASHDLGGCHASTC